MNTKAKNIDGYILAFVSYLLWGILPIYWKQVGQLTAMEILANRIFWSFMMLIIFILVTKKKGFIEYLKNKKIRKALFLTGSLVSINWLVFIYAINTNHVVQVSLGYYINPIISIFFGMLLLKEKMTKLQITAIVLAIIGVAYMTISNGEFPWISIVLAVTFGLYGLFKKIYALDSILSLLGELLILLPLSTIYLIYLGIEGQSHLLSGEFTLIIYILLSGIVTVTPLFLFAEGAKKIPLSSVGFLQYIAPTIMLLIGVFMYGESFTHVHKISFMFIWGALLLYLISVIKSNKK